MRDNNFDNDRGEQTTDRQKGLTNSALSKYNGSDALDKPRLGRFNGEGPSPFKGQWNGASSDLGSNEKAGAVGSGNDEKPEAKKQGGAGFGPTVPESVRSVGHKDTPMN